MADELELRDGTLIPAAELTWRFDPSGGPGGQHANRAATRAEVSFDVSASTAFEPGRRQDMLERLGRRAAGGVVTVASDASRSQWRNRRLALRRLAELLEESMVAPTPRRPTRPSRSARRRRLADKRARSETKRLRRPPEPD